MMPNNNGTLLKTTGQSDLQELLPPSTANFLSEFIETTKKVLEGDLVSAVLYGSAAEGKLRTTSDVNLILVLRSFEPTKANDLRHPLRAAEAAIKEN